MADLLNIPNALAQGFTNWGQQAGQNIVAGRERRRALDDQNALAAALPGALSGDPTALAAIYKADPNAGLKVNALLRDKANTDYTREQDQNKLDAADYATAAEQADRALALSDNQARDLPFIRKQLIAQFSDRPHVQAKIAQHIPEQWDESMRPLVMAGGGAKIPEPEKPTSDLLNYKAGLNDPGFRQYQKDNKTLPMQFKLDNPSLLPQSAGGGAGANPDDLETYANAIANGQAPPLTTVGQRNPNNLKIMARVLELNPEYHGYDYGTHAAGEKYWTSGAGGKTLRSFNAAHAHLDTLSGLTGALGNGQTPVFNKIANEWAKQTGGTAPSNFDAVKRLVADEVTKAIVGGVTALGDREETAAAINSAQTPQQLAGVIKNYQELMKGQIEASRMQYESGSGKNDFYTRFKFAPGIAPAVTGSDAPPSAPPSTGGLPPDIAAILVKHGAK